MTQITCVECAGSIDVDDGLMQGEILQCPDCGVELEVLTLNPLTVELAPEVEEEAAAPEVEEEAVVELFGDPLRGGLLYDKWWKITGADQPGKDYGQAHAAQKPRLRGFDCLDCGDRRIEEAAG